MASLVAQLVKNLPANAGDTRDTSSIPGLGRYLGEGNGNPFCVFFFFLPGKSHGQRSLVGYSPWGYKNSDMTEHTESQKGTWGYRRIFKMVKARVCLNAMGKSS